MLKIQSLLHVCSEHYASSESEEKSESTAAAGSGSGSATSNAASGASSATEDQSSDSASNKKKKATKAKADPGSLIEPGSHQGLATLGIALLAMGENIGMDMCLRMYNHLVWQ